ncbi:MAG: DEAD/DEAH box helicase [Patescibacteria group bacterium]
MQRQSFRPQNRPRFGGNPRMQRTLAKSELMRVIDASKRAQSEVPVEEDVYKATNTFADFGLSEGLMANITYKQYVTPTPIQDQAIPAIREGRDLIGTAQTGTGKTAAFLIPLIEKIVQDKAQRVLVIAPTRELAFQIHKEMREFSRGLGIRSAMLIGGANEWRQRSDMRLDPHFVVATPGRLKDFIQTKVVRMSAFRNVVLDEVDQMVDIGFINDIKFFISLLPPERQSLFFSATISGKVNDILKDFVKNPVTVSIKANKIVETIRQDVIYVQDRNKKVDMLHDLLNSEGFDKVLVFGRTKWGVQKLADELGRRGFRAGAIHGNKRQNQRQYVLTQFMRSEIQVLLATDVASRGLDIPDVSHVINFDLPETIDDYTHRIGRTGRANKAGIALTFVE